MQEGFPRQVKQRVLAILAERKITGAALATKLGVSDMWVSRRLRGETHITLIDLERIARALNVPVEVFLSSPERAA